MVKILVKQNNRNNSGDANDKEARALPFVVAVNAVVSVVLLDQNLDQKLDLGWPGSSPGLGQGQALGWALVKPWAGPWSSPGKIGPENWPAMLAKSCQILA